MPRLSFIVPTFKPKADVFEKCVKSLAAQALDSWEAIFVLDGPSQEARKIIGRHMKDKAFSIVEIEHAGAQAARNEGAKHAQADILCFFDADCVIEPGTSKMWVDQFDKHPEVGFIYSGYKFFGEKYAIEGQPWDPWTLKVRNYISGCFPMRKSLYPGWTEGLKSLQDWDMWLSLVEKAESLGWDVNKLGLYVQGYAFSTAMPEIGSISGDGCQPDVWLDRVNAVKTLHHLEDRKVCVSSLGYRHDGLALAKLINADYQDVPNDKPHNYKTIIQVGFSLGANAEKHAAIFQEKHVKKILFWTGDDINEMYHSVAFKTIDAFAQLLNNVAVQYCEDREAKRLLERMGFKASIMTLPLGVPNVQPMPEAKKWVVDIASDYSPMISVIAQSLPDIELEMIDRAAKLSDYKGLIHFFPDRTTTGSIKRAHLTGRHVISNVQQPYCGFIDDKWDVEKFIIECVDKIRELTSKDAEADAPAMYSSQTAKLMEVCA